MIVTMSSGQRAVPLSHLIVVGLTVFVLAVGCGDTGSTAGPAKPVEATSASSRPATPSTSARVGVGEDSTTTTKRSTSSAGRREAADPADPIDTLSPADGADLPRACDLITEQDASRVLGEPVTAGDQRRDECWWSTANDLKTVNIIRRSEDLDQWRSGYQNNKWQKVDRGDEGYAGKVLTSIVFRIGEAQYEINVVFSTNGDPARS